MKKILLIFVSVFVLLGGFTQAQSLIPADVSNTAEIISGVSQGGHVLENQKKLIKSGKLTTAQQINTGIMSRDTILDYCVFLVKFLGEVALLIGAVAIIYLGYKRITKNVFGESPKGLTMIVIGILVVIFAYVIVKLLWSAFIS